MTGGGRQVTQQQRAVEARLSELVGSIDQADWRLGALCSQVDPEMFYPDVGAAAYPAKQICGACDVRNECLNDVMSRESGDERFGVVAGLTPNERRRLSSHGDISQFEVPGRTPCPICGARFLRVSQHLARVNWHRKAVA